jgi:uncharacterized protein (TIGR02452 family)
MEQSSILPFLKASRAPQRPSRPENSRPGHPYQHRPKTDSRNSNYYNSKYRGPNHRRNADLEKVADETKAVLPKILPDIPDFDATESSLTSLEDLDALSAADCPGFKRKACIKVLNMDSFDAAIQLDPQHDVHKHLATASSDVNTELGDVSNPNPSLSFSKSPSKNQDSEHDLDHHISRSVLVLNLASERSPGGGWQKGALAQEECLCYRSSLPLSLSPSFYPIPSLSAIYTPNVVLIRTSMADGHTLFPTTQLQAPSGLPAVSVVSAAALRKPALSDDNKAFKHPGARATTKRKIRLVLRLAARNKHTKLVLGALGCGVFANPPQDVASCFSEVFDEDEFHGGWWQDVVFAVLDNVKSGSSEGGKDGNGNFGIFYRALDGKEI